MRVLYIIDNLEFGGGERAFLQLAQGLKDRYQVFVGATPGGIFENKLKNSGILLYHIDMSRRFSLKPIHQIIDIVLSKKIDLIHSQGIRADFYSRIAARKLGSTIRLVDTIAMPVEGFDVSPSRKKIYSFFDRFSERYVDRFIVVSETLKKTLINNHRIPKHKVIRIYNGIELKEYQPDDSGESFKQPRKEFCISEGVSLIGAIGRLVWQKGFEYLIEAIPEVLKEYQKVKFLFIGEGPLKERLKVKSERLRTKDYIIFAGFRKDIKEVLTALDILVIPSLREGFPIITLEAMAMAKPIIATRIGGITEQITDGKNGILVPPKDPFGIAKAIIRFISNKELARKMALSGKKSVEESFSVEKMVAETEKVYQSLVPDFFK